MSLFDSEHPQHLAHLARAKAASRRTTEMLDAADRCEGMAEAKAAAAIDRENRRVPWAVRVRAA